MDVPKTPSAKDLREMSYSELKKIAKQRGIKGNLKAEKIIAALITVDSDDTDSFSTPAAQEMNSSRKKKEEKLDQDSMTPLETPRRGTYSIGSPIVLKENDITLHSLVNESSVLDMSNAAASGINESSILDMSNITIGRGSERKLRTRKVSFLSPVMTPRTPKNSNLKMRPKTPIANQRLPFPAAISLSPMKELKVNLGQRVDAFPSIHLSEKVSNEPDSKSTPLKTDNEILPKEKSNDTPKSTPLKASNAILRKEKPNDTPKPKTLQIHKQASTKKNPVFTPKLTKSLPDKTELSKKKRLATPNFKKIHEKAFEKMESIEDYQKRILTSAKKMGMPNFKANKITKAKSKIPAFGGIPFIPSVSKSAAKWEPPSLNKWKPMEEKRKPERDVENVNTRSKRKFDLKASLSRKLGYKPYTGPLKPLTPSTLLNTSRAASVHKGKETPAKEPTNKTVASVRLQNRSLLKGVRTNKRFELQMKNRKI